MKDSAREHYSYAVYADAATAESFDRVRFGGPIGHLLSETQERVVAGFLGDVARRDILDVGVGTGRAALALARRGARVTGVDASAAMLEVAARRAAAEAVAVTLIPGDAHALAFPDRSFDAAICLRVLMHTPDWRQCLGELCRVARRQVVFDYPALLSVAALQVGFRRLAQVAGAPVEAYRVLSTGSVARQLHRHGFRLAGIHRQFVLPIALHRWIGSRRATEGLEDALEKLGLLRLLGSPVTVVAERCAS